MKLTKIARGNAAILVLNGDFDSFVCRPFLDQIEQFATTSVPYVVLNMKKVAFISSTGIGSLIKSRKRLKQVGGDLVISRPSDFVQEAIDSTGISAVVKSFADDEEALAFLNAGEGIELGGEDKILFNEAGESASPRVGRIKRLEEKGLTFETPEKDLGLGAKATLKLKFRLPLYQKSHYFNITSQVTRTVHTAHGVTVSTAFTEMPEADRTSITQFVKDMQFLRNEARQP